MSFLDLLRLAIRNLREAKLRAALTTIGVVVGVAVIVTMISFGLGLQRNTVERFKNLDLFNEVEVYGRTINSILEAQLNKSENLDDNSNQAEAKNNRSNRRNKPSARSLNDTALEEIAAIPGVAYVEPNVRFSVFVRANGQARELLVGGVRVPNDASRFKNFAAGNMIGVGEQGAAVVDESFLSQLGYKGAADAISQTVEFLAPPEEDRARGDAKPPADEEDEATPGRTATPQSAENTDAAAGGNEDNEPLSFFGLPLDGPDEKDAGNAGEDRAKEDRLVARTFRIVGVLKNEIEESQGSSRRFRGMMPAANVYITLQNANEWVAEHRGMLNEVALALARQSGALDQGETEGYQAATVRVSDPAAMNMVVNRLRELGFNTFGLFTELDEIRTFFLVVNSALGLLGGISLLVASFGIANTMIMSIFERTREIGIMKAIGAEDGEIKLIFFTEAAVIGLAGGIVGSLAAWGIDKLANRLVYEFILKPRGEPFIDFFSLPPYLWLGAILFAMIIAIIAALYPAARAARIDPVKALRHD